MKRCLSACLLWAMLAGMLAVPVCAREKSECGADKPAAVSEETVPIRLGEYYGVGDRYYSEQESNDTWQTAGALENDDTVAGTVFGSDEDWFRLTLEQESTISVAVMAGDANMTFGIYDGQGKQSLASTDMEPSGSSYGAVINRTLSAGTYHLRVWNTARRTAAYVIYCLVDPVPTAPVIREEPVSVSAVAGQTAKFNVSAEGSGLSYRWEFKAPSMKQWADATAPGNTTDTLSVPATLWRDGYQYRCVVSGSLGQTCSAPALLTVCAAHEITAHPVSVIAAQGESACFEVAAEGSGLSCQWQFCTPTSGWYSATAAGNQTPKLTVPATVWRDGYRYRCRVTDADGTKVWSDPAVLNVVGITRQPEDKKADVGETARFTVSASGGTLSYQWKYKSPDMKNWADATAPGNRTAVLRVPATDWRDGYQYRCVVSRQRVSAVSDGAVLSVRTAPEILEQPKSVAVKAGETAAFTVKAEGKALSFQWQFKTARTGWAKATAPGNKTDTLSVPGTLWRNGYQYRCMVTDANGSVLYSNAASLSVK